MGVCLLLLCLSAVSFAATIPMRASLNGAQEVPPNLGTPATGTAVLTFDTVSRLLSWSISYSGLQSPISDAHFHGPTPAGVDAGVQISIGPGASPLVGSATLTPQQASDLLAGQYYINIHSDLLPGGEIRGQVVPVRKDFSADGKADILWRNSDGSVAIWLMDGLTQASGGGLGVVPTSWTIAGVGDFDGDGKADILWRNSDGNVAIWLMNGLTQASGGGLGVVPTSWTIAGVGDFSGDGKADILWRNSDGSVAIWLMNGLTQANGGGLGVVPTSWTTAGVGDFSGDGKADIVWRNTDGSVAIWLMNGLTQASGGGLGVVPTSWTISGVGDFDGDGRSDILWRNSDGSAAVWLMNGLTQASGGGLGGVPTSWTISSVGDFNGDGNADILWRNSDGTVAIWLMNGITLVNGGGLGVVPTSWDIQPSSLASALAGVQLSLENIKQTVNAQGDNLAGTHLVGFYDVNFLDDGVDETIDSGELAESLRGVTISSLTIDRVISYDDSNKVLAVVVTLSSPSGTMTAGEREGGLAFKKQVDGSWKLYGHRRLGVSNVQVEMRTDKTPSGVTAARQNVNVDFRAPQGTVNSVTITGGNGLFNNTPVPSSNSTELVTVQAYPPPGAPTFYFRDTFFAGSDSALAGLSSFTFAVTPASGPVVSYSVPSNPVTNEFVTVTSPTLTTLATANLGGTLPVTWTLPGFAIAEVRLSGHVRTAVEPTPGVTCQIEGPSLATNATSGNISFPTTCNGQPVQKAAINVSVDGVNGERTIYIYLFFN